MLETSEYVVQAWKPRHSRGINHAVEGLKLAWLDQRPVVADIL